jgi:hypothetical protein
MRAPSRSRWWLRAAVALAAAVASAGASGAVGAGADAAAGVETEPAPVASLEPEKTAALWRRLVARRSRQAQTPADCRPLRAVFYAPTDWLRLATKLASAASPCAEYYVSVPPIVADKTQPRRDAAWRIRALGPNFHAMAEFHFATWTRWVQSTGSTWYQAGVTARERMAAAGYDFAAGDTWVVNEASSAVRRGTGSARTILRELLRGLYEGDGTRPTKGAVFVIGVGQQTNDVSLLQTNLQNWFADSAFWADMGTYVSDWSQEVYGDVRNWAVAGAPLSTRRDYLSDYLHHKLVLAGVGPPTIDTARSYLQSTFSPLANAAWEREAGYGWTMVPPEQMASWVSAQVHALRYFSATSAQPRDHWGFAWAPRNAAGVPADQFAARSALILDRMAAAVRDSGATPDPADPGSAACGPPGQNLFCLGDVAGARLNESWRSFRVWTQSVLSFATQPQTVSAGSPSGPLSLSLVTASGLSVTTPVPLTVTLSSSSPQGSFATSPAGPWSPTLSLTIAAGTGTAGPFHYLDTEAGTHTLTASATGATSGTQTVTVTAGPVTALRISPGATTLRARGSSELTATGVDAFGNALPVAATWSLTPRSLGAVSPRTGAETTLTAGRTLGAGAVTASVTTAAGRVSAGARVRVMPGRVSVGSIRYRSRKGLLLVTATVVDAFRRPVSGAVVSIAVNRNGRLHLATRGSTGASGRKVYRVRARNEGCFVTKIRRVAAQGFTWNGRTPRNRFCTR